MEDPTTQYGSWRWGTCWWSKISGCRCSSEMHDQTRLMHWPGRWCIWRQRRTSNASSKKRAESTHAEEERVGCSFSIRTRWNPPCSTGSIQTSGTWPLRQKWEMWIRSNLCRIPRVRDFALWDHNGCTQGSGNHRLACPYSVERGTIISWFCKFLSTVYQWFFLYRATSNHPY